MSFLPCTGKFRLFSSMFVLINPAGFIRHSQSCIQSLSPYLYYGVRYFPRVSIRKTFAQLLLNETQNVSFFAHQFCAKKKQQFAQSFAKVILRKNCPIPLLRISSFTQFRNFVQNPKQIVQ